LEEAPDRRILGISGKPAIQPFLGPQPYSGTAPYPAGEPDPRHGRDVEKRRCQRFPVRLNVWR